MWRILRRQAAPLAAAAQDLTTHDIPVAAAAIADVASPPAVSQARKKPGPRLVPYQLPIGTVMPVTLRRPLGSAAPLIVYIPTAAPSRAGKR